MIWVYWRMNTWIFFFFFFFQRMLIYYIDILIVIEWRFLKFNSLDLKLYLIIDWISIIFIRVIIFISIFIILYRIIYIKYDKFKKRFIYLLLLFIISIIFIVLRPNLFRILFGWDRLGLVSYLLVVYYQNFSSYNSGIVTVLCNRLGDVGILISLGLVIYEGFWRFLIYKSLKILIIILIIIAALTKSAQIPFSVWLPIAIAAPTPISALVHSSTLVTAGVYLIIRFNKFLFIRGINYQLLILSVITIFISRFMAIIENDLKKIIALSTLRQLGLIIIILRLGEYLISFYHLLTHAIFKSLLFISAGVIIHLVGNNQDIRLLGGVGKIIPFLSIRLYISILALIGIIFLSGFYSKDLVIELVIIFKINPLVFFIIIIRLIFTVIYSIRLFYYIFIGEVKFYRYKLVKEVKVINFSIILLIIIRIIIGSFLNWIFYYDYYLIFINLQLKIFILEIIIIGVILRIFLKSLIFVKYYYLRYFLRSIWFLNHIYINIYKFINKIGNLIFIVDKTWSEYINKRILLYLKWYWKIMNFKIYIFVVIFVYLIIILYLVR